jgi:hypothetical protein
VRRTEHQIARIESKKEVDYEKAEMVKNYESYASRSYTLAGRFGNFSFADTLRCIWEGASNSGVCAFRIYNIARGAKLELGEDELLQKRTIRIK